MVFLPAMGSIDFWLYKLFYMRCNLLEGQSIITVFSWHRKNYVIDGGARKIQIEKLFQKIAGRRDAQNTQFIPTRIETNPPCRP